MAPGRSGLLAGVVVVAAFLPTLSCSADRGDPCAEANELLRHSAEQTDPAECRKIVAFAHGPIVAEWPSFWDWHEGPGSQPIEVALELTMALAQNANWEPRSFGPEPATVPCSRGLVVDDAFWKTSQLGAAGVRPQPRLFASWELELSPKDPSSDEQHVLIRVRQDSDCDGNIAVSKIEGAFKRGVLVVRGGWRPIRSSIAPLYE